MPTWPDSIKHEYLRTDANPTKLLEACRDLYEGPQRQAEGKGSGTWFQEKYLDRRSADPQGEGGIHVKSQTGGLDKEDVAAHRGFANLKTNKWASKKTVCRYTNRTAGMLDHVVASVLRFRPEIKGPGPYWKALNDDIDGRGTDFIQYLRKVVIEALLTARPYLSIVGKSIPMAANLKQFEDAGGNDYKLDCLYRETVTDYVEDNGLLQLARTYRCDPVREDLWRAGKKKRHLWTFVTDREIVEYEIIIDEDKGDKLDDNTEIQRKAPPAPHGLTGPALVPVRIMDGMWAMARLKDPTLKLYNLDAGILYNAWQCNFPAPYLRSQRTDIPGFQFGEDTMPVVQPDEGFEWFAAPSEHLERCQSERDQARRDLYEVFASMAHHAAALAVQNPRQSAQAKGMDREPFALLLQTVADGPREALLIALRRIAAKRGDDPEKVQVTGLDKFADTEEGQDAGAELQSALEGDNKQALAAQELGLAAERFRAQGNEGLARKIETKTEKIIDSI